MRRFKSIWWALLALLLVQPSRAEIQPAPAAAGRPALDPVRLARIDDLVREKVRQGELAGMVVLVARHGRIEHLSATGHADAGKKTPIARNSLFRIYSMTKAITATALLMLYEDGRFALDDPVSRYIPAFKGVRVLRTPSSAITDTVPARTEPTIHDLLRHTAGFSHGLAVRGNPVDQAYLDADLFGPGVSLEEMTARLARIPLRNQPGTKWEYSVSPDVEARLVEILSGMTFADFLEKRIFAPLGMKDTSFRVQPDQASRLVPVHRLVGGRLVACREDVTCPPPEHFLMNPADMNGYRQLRRHTGGSYGLVSTAEDYWRFTQMLLNGGTLDGHRLLAPRTVRFMTTDHLGAVPMPDVAGRPSGAGWGLGVAVVKDPAANGDMLSTGSFYWGGIAGTTFWVDPRQDLTVVAMTQHMSVPAVNEAFASIKSIVYSALPEVRNDSRAWP